MTTSTRTASLNVNIYKQFTFYVKCLFVLEMCLFLVNVYTIQCTLVFCTNKRNFRCVYLLKCCPPNGSHSFSVDHSEMYSFEFSLTLACLEVSALTKIMRLYVQRLWSVNLATHRLSSSSHRLPIEVTKLIFCCNPNINIPKCSSLIFASQMLK